jgi:pyruvate/2-oxoglutarate/acetoin dehydrogenase E1 component
MFMDFLLLAMDQIGNHAAKFAYMYGEPTRVPLTIRTPAGGRRGYGPTHSQCFESLLLSLPGLKVVTPASVQDAYELLRAAIRDDGPVVVVEHKLLYGLRGRLDPALTPTPPGRARILREGADCTIVTFSHMVTLALEAAVALAGEGIEAEILDLRTLEPLDMDAVAASAARTQRVLVAEEGTRRGGVGAELAARIQEECFGMLDAPVLRVAAADCPVPAAAPLERAVLPQVADIVLAARSLLSPEL